MGESSLVIIASSHLDDAESHERIEDCNLSEKALNKFLYR